MRCGLLSPSISLLARIVSRGQTEEIEDDKVARGPQTAGVFDASNDLRPWQRPSM